MSKHVVKQEHIVSRITYPLLAKVGHKLTGSQDEQATEFWKHYYDEEIETYEMNRFSSIQEILSEDNPIDDFIMLSEKRNFSMDYDFKRKPSGNGKTVPHQVMDDFLRHRQSASNLREKKGERATVEKVDYYQSRAKQNVRKRGSGQSDCVRHWLRAQMQAVYPFTKIEGASFSQIAKKLSDYEVSVNNIKDARRNVFIPNMIFNSSKNRRVIRDLLKLFNYETIDNYQEFLDLLIHKGISNGQSLFS
jgi:hypothetical protein